MKQISNFKFYDMNDATIKVGIDGRSIKNNNGTVKVIDPNGDTLYMSEKDANILYKRLYAAKYVDKIVENALKEVGLTVKNAHLSTYNELKKFESLLENNLRKEKIDLSFLPETITNKYGFHISGNALGITSSCVTKLWSRAWEEVKMTTKEIEEYLIKNPKVNLYIKDNYFAVKKANKTDFINTNFGTTFKSQGIGSASSVVENSVILKKDEFGNLFIDKMSFIWD